MEKPFLPFNDYLGLSNIFKQPQNDDPKPVTVEHDVNIVSRSVSDAWIDKRIEEILHQYSLKRALQTSQTENSVSGNYNYMMKPDLSRQNSFYNSSTTFSNSDFFGSNSFTSNNMRSGERLNTVPLSSSGSWIMSNVTPCFQPSNNFSHIYNSGFNSGSTHSFDQNSFDSVQSNLSSLSICDSLSESQQFSLASNQHANRRNNLGCSFCRNNKEVDDWVMSHQLKDSLNRVMCPILRSYVCPLCFASGDNAHTLGHCPLNPDKKNSSLPLAVRRRTNATGRVKL